jgi:hypothetical protein
MEKSRDIADDLLREMIQKKSLSRLRSWYLYRLENQIPIGNMIYVQPTETKVVPLASNTGVVYFFRSYTSSRTTRLLSNDVLPRAHMAVENVS